MPLIDGKFEPLELPEIHHRVLTDRSKKWKYRALWGGRNGAKDWSMIAQIIEIGVRSSLRVLFTREVQNTIKESVYQLLCDTIKRLGYSQYYRVLNTEIKGVLHDTSFIFKGINDINVNDIKSYEGIDIVVICEGESFTETSFDVLDPTIRKPGSEIWFQFNSLFDDDFVYKFCVTDPPDDLIGALVTYLDNPWTTEEQKKKADRSKHTDINKYNHIWLGHTIKGGLFFNNFGPHLMVDPFPLSPHMLVKRLYISMDYGYGPTGISSAGLWFENVDGIPYRLMTWQRIGLTASQQADDLLDTISVFFWTSGAMPCKFIFDNQMAINTRQDNQTMAPIDYFKQKFSMIKDVSDSKGNPLNWIPSIKNRVPGWAIVSDFFSLDGLTQEPKSRYWGQDLNTTFEKGFQKVVQDPNNPGDVFKCAIDHPCDETRYFYVWFLGRYMAVKISKANPSGKTTMRSIQNAINNMNFGPTGG